MTEDEELQAMSQALAAADNDPWTPRCVAEAFLGEPLVIGKWALAPLTLGGWLRLECVRSPFVTGQFPADIEGRVQALCYALNVLDGSAGASPSQLMAAMSAQEAVAMEETVATWINRAFATALPMHRPRKANEPARDHGFGWWMRVFTKLVSELHFQPGEALKLPLAQAFALLATYALLDGCEPKEMNWKEREALDGLPKEVANG